MSLILALFAAAGIDPETEAVMGRRRAAPVRRQEQAAPALDAQLEQCADLARHDPAAALTKGRQWVARSDGPAARQCQGYAHAQSGDWTSAASDFRTGARMAGDDGATAARLWAQAGNAALAGGDLPAAISALDTALTGAALPDGLERGEAFLDRARARVATHDQSGARADLDQALRMAPEDPLAWLLSATLARRMDDLVLAKDHIGRAAALAGDDASVALEQGVIAALGNEDPAAIAAFRKARTLGAGTPLAEAANRYLAQLGDSAPPAAAVPVDTARPPEAR